MERETFVGIDVGTTKVVALIGEVGRDGALTIIGKGIVPASGLRKGVVVNIDQTVHSISAAVEKAERHAGYKIERAFVGVGGNHVEGLNSPGQVAVAGPRREVAQEDVNRSIEVARAVSIPSTREVLHGLGHPFIEGAPILVEVRDEPGGFADAAERLAAAGVNVCGTLMVGRRPGIVEMIFCVDDEAKAHAALHQTPVEEVGVAD